MQNQEILQSNLSDDAIEFILRRVQASIDADLANDASPIYTTRQVNFYRYGVKRVCPLEWQIFYDAWVAEGRLKQAMQDPDWAKFKELADGKFKGLA